MPDAVYPLRATGMATLKPLVEQSLRNTEMNVLLKGGLLRERANTDQTNQISERHCDHSEVFSAFQKRSVLLLHMLRLSTVNILHRSVLAAMSASGSAGIRDLVGTAEDAKAYEEHYLVATQQSSCIAAILTTDVSIRKHCWLTIDSSNGGALSFSDNAASNVAPC
ncbi:hypothetical protein K469DRAFT_682149 [Zopfia rhizophila CBS 207.26]|uniref:Uncharacterized protein n=1 Tax=Zopfia rhizophila CBS 207.26 TaxID=1314779 RepID=A0A6A6F1A9_9PEZI|nr:hypothetical protein K469DRAFT_682149 [Zopfia rhizophila CBS 207.26]